MGLIGLKKVKKEENNQNNNVYPDQMNYSTGQGYPVNNGYDNQQYGNYQDNQYMDPNMQYNQNMQYDQNVPYNQNIQYDPNMQYNQSMQQPQMVDSQPVVNDPSTDGGYYEVSSQEQNNLNYEAINNMRNISMESTAPVQEEEPKQEVEELVVEGVEEVPKLDPLNNANNPIPVNPVAVDVVVDDSGDDTVKTGLFVNIGICIGLVFKPATTIVNNTKKFRNTNKAFQIFIWMFILSIVLCIASRVVLGSFTRVFSNLTGRYQLSFDMGRIFDIHNYLGWLIATVIVSGIFVLLVALVYYASSFMNSKGISFGTYLMLATLGNVPITVGLLILFPLGSLFSSYLAVILLFISFLYGFFIFIIGAINVLKFSGVDSLVIYNLMNMAIIGGVISIILIFVVRYTSYDLSYLLSIAGLG